MGSIRRTVLVSSLLLLVATLGVVSWVVYRSNVDVIRDRQQTGRQLAHVLYEEKLDEDLRNRTAILARDVQQNFQFDRSRDQRLASVVSAVTMPASGHGLWSYQTSLLTTVPVPGNLMAFEVNVMASTELRLSEDEIYRESEPAAPFEFIQLSNQWRSTWTSRSLSGQPMPPDADGHRHDGDITPRLDTVVLADGRTVRRVIMSAPVTRYGRVGTMPWFDRPRREDSPGPSRAAVGLAVAARPPGGPRPSGPTLLPPPPPPRPQNRVDRVPTFKIQCAWELSPNNPRVAAIMAERDSKVADVDEESEAAMRNMKKTLAATVGLSLLVSLLGGWFIVGFGLAPLRRLTEAVSSISAKDFTLPIDPKSLPSEVNPVAERLSQSLSQLQAAFEREKRAAADISHELRTPLAALTTTLEVALRKERSPDQYRTTLDECRGIARQMSQLVERMLALAWVDAGADQVRPERVEVPEVIAGLAAIAKPLAEAQGVAVLTDIPTRLSVVTDPAKLREIAMNLIHNAIEYNHPGGEVRISAAPRTGGGIVLEVRDTGVGMPPEIQDKVFERFFRGDPSRQATGIHAGLGLAIVKEYVERLGGSLKVESAVDVGSRFRIELPNL